MRERWRNDRSHGNSRRAGAQSEERGRRCAAGEDRRHRGGVRVGQVVAGAGRAVCRGLAALSGGAVHLHAPQDDAGREGRGRRGALRPRRAGAASAAGRAGHPQHVRHRNRAAQRPAADVLAAGEPPLPQRPRFAADAGRRRRAGAAVPGVRRAVLRAVGGGAGVQQPGRLPHLRRNRRGAHGRPCDAGAGREPDHRRGRRRAVEFADVVADDRRLPRDGRAHRRAVSRADR